MDQVALASLISFALILTGVAGLLLPTLPGALMIWLGIVAFGENIWNFVLIQFMQRASQVTELTRLTENE